jgi:flavin-dependent dehydrogenase
MADIRVGDAGTELVVVVVDESGAAVDVSSAGKTIYLRKPDGTVLTKTAVNDTTGTNGKMKYVTQAGDLDRAGEWEIEGKVVVGANSWKTAISNFDVGAVLA